jgi:hypothetical protein
MGHVGLTSGLQDTTEEWLLASAISVSLSWILVRPLGLSVYICERSTVCSSFKCLGWIVTAGPNQAGGGDVLPEIRADTPGLQETPQDTPTAGHPRGFLYQVSPFRAAGRGRERGSGGWFRRRNGSCKRAVSRSGGRGVRPSRGRRSRHVDRARADCGLARRGRGTNVQHQSML